MTKPDYWIVRLDAFAFDTEAEAIAYRDALNDAFCAMPESEGIAATTKVIPEMEPVLHTADEEFK